MLGYCPSEQEIVVTGSLFSRPCDDERGLPPQNRNSMSKNGKGFELETRTPENYSQRTLSKLGQASPSLTKRYEPVFTALTGRQRSLGLATYHTNRHHLYTNCFWSMQPICRAALVRHTSFTTQRHLPLPSYSYALSVPFLLHSVAFASSALQIADLRINPLSLNLSGEWRVSRRTCNKHY